MGSNKTRLFLSSTHDDLGEYREVVTHVGHRLGLEVVAMEDFGPDSAIPVDLCEKKVRSADLFVALYAHRYGFQPAGFEGKSITELEYDWAIDAGLEILIFLLAEDQPWIPGMIDEGDPKARLSALKASHRSRHTVATLTTPERLRSDLFQHLPKLLDSHESEPDAAHRPALSLIPSTPEPYVAHPYTLLQTKNLVGRDKELGLLDQWVRGSEGDRADVRLLCLVAIGGMGKSAVTWKWFQQHAAESFQPLTGRMWWSFYESDAGYQQFLSSALAYCTGQRRKEMEASLSLSEQEAALLAVLDREPFLLVLDGAERLLLAYSGLDFAHLSDDELDTRTANQVAGALGLDAAETETMVAQHRLRNTIDPHAGVFLRKLASVRASRILVTTRLFPSALQTVTGQAMPGSEAVFLRGLTPSDALALWREMGVGGGEEELEGLFAKFDHYPLLIRALAGEVARFRPAPGDFDAWQRAYPEFNPYRLPLVQVKSHVLAYALQGLGEEARHLLQTIAAFRAPVTYDTLAALFNRSRPEGTDEATSRSVLDKELSELEDRSLIGWDRAANHYDLHPIVRGVVWEGLPEAQKMGVHQVLRSHFEAFPASKKEELSVSEATPVLELFHSLVALEKFHEASGLYFERINHVVDFWGSGQSSMNLAMLRSLFPAGLDSPPEGLEISTYAQLGHAFRRSLDFENALRCYRLLWSSEDRSQMKPQVGGFIGRLCLDVGLLEEAGKWLKIACLGTDMWARFDAGSYAVYWAMLGQLELANECLEQAAAGAQTADEDDTFEISHYYPLIQVVSGDYRSVDVDEASLITCARAWLGMELAEKVIKELAPAHLESREKSWSAEEVEFSSLLAEAHRMQGNLDFARQLLLDSQEIAKRGPCRLLLAEAYNVLAKVERDAKNRPAAIAAAAEAFRQSWCDGPPHAHHWELQRAIAMLEELGSPQPDPPPRDTRFDELLSQIDTSEFEDEFEED